MTTRDPAIKLFGKTIALEPQKKDDVPVSGSRKGKEILVEADVQAVAEVEKKDSSSTKPIETKDIDLDVPPLAKEQTEYASSSSNNEVLNNPDEGLKAEDEQNEVLNENSEEKTLKKPDKIVPCPRCNSMDTKFCYYNNYNVNQPRHFCKNCQRYWTAGGTIRNVPVGAGRRKNKITAAPVYLNEDALQSARANLPDRIHLPTLRSNGTVLTFASDISHAPLCDSKASSSFTGGEQGNHGPSFRNLNHTHEQETHNFQGYPPQNPFYSGAAWPYPWNSMPPNFCPPSFPIPFYHPAYFGCLIPGNWNFPWSQPLPQLPTPSFNSQTLGKRSREEVNHKPNVPEIEVPSKRNSPERSLWVPKTLRIDDPSEAACSSLWATLGINRVDSTSGGGMLKAFESKRDGKNQTGETSSAHQANPAALSRFANFNESLS